MSAGLTARDAQALAALAVACAAARSEAQLGSVGPMLQALIPHRSCVLAVVDDQGHAPWVVGAAREGTAACRDAVDSTRLAGWMISRQPWIAMASGPARDEPPGPSERLAGHGLIDAGASLGTYAEMTGVPAHWPDRWLRLRLHLVMPHLHQAIVGVRHRQPIRPARQVMLTEVERELLACLAAGQSNKQIAHARSRSEATIRNQLHALFRKLGVKNRLQAVRVGLG